MKKFLKVILAGCGTLLSASTFIWLSLSFMNVEVTLLGNKAVESVGNGYEFAFNQIDALEDGEFLGSLFAFIFTILAVLCGFCACYLALTKKKGNAGLIAGGCAAIFGITAAVLFFLTLQTTGATEGISVGSLIKTKATLGVGAILSGVATALGGLLCCCSSLVKGK